ncbi:MAG TPA: LacI family transcriptional regulator [Chloroflexi bacterium]|nr:LacI family transcriptional regulator [Chloroflexota bacterium]HBY09492.1 LacI family transcriptional regulator [Chloroflexota bacterium]
MPLAIIGNDYVKIGRNILISDFSCANMVCVSCYPYHSEILTKSSPMPTIRDVAKLAGVAPITVSRVINDTSYVSQETRGRVESAIEELGYVPNMLGPSLRFQQTLTLAVVITDITNPFWTTVTRGVEDIAQANGYSTILCNTDESDEKQDQYLHMLLRRRIDGILLVPACSDAKPIELIRKQAIPVVVLDRRIPDVDVDIVRADSEAGAYQLTQHLISLGHRNIMMLAGPKSVSTSVDRVDGYQNALREANLPENTSHVVWGNYSQEAGYQMTQEVLTLTPRPTAIFAANNFVAVGVMQALQEQGIRVPQDIALVAFDDLPSTFTITPFFTVARQPAREMGQRATQLLLERIKGASDVPCQHVILPTQVIIRASSGERIAA